MGVYNICMGSGEDGVGVTAGNRARVGWLGTASAAFSYCEGNIKAPTHP